MRRKLGKSKRAVFIDRDGTILKERGYLGSSRKLKFYSSVFGAIRKLNERKFKVVIITNQSGVGRGYFSKSIVDRIHRELKEKVAVHKGRIDGIYVCPHLPDAGCNCRKPRTGLAKQAARELNLDLKRSYVIGDQLSDLNFAKNIKAKGILVLTGAGLATRSESGRLAGKISANLSGAVDWIIRDIADD